jgi:magnesium transporter
MDFLLITPDSVTLSATAPEALPENGFVWCDVMSVEPRVWVEPIERLSGASIFEDHLLDAENPAHPSYFDSTQLYEMIVFRGLAIAPPTGRGASIRIRTRPTVFFLMPGILVTIRAADSRLVPALRERLIASPGTHQRLPAGPEDLMLRLLNQMVDRYLDLRQPFTDQVESWQKQLLDPRRPFNDWFQLMEARTEAQKLESLCEEQLDAIQEWRDERLEHFEHGVDCPPTALPKLKDSTQVRANDVVEHIQRVLSHAKRLEASVEASVQLHFSATAHRTNEIIRTLTTITAVFMPLTLITGIFGMNFEFIPGSHSRSGFWITILVMGILAAGMLMFFKARRYIAGSDLDKRAKRRKEQSETMPQRVDQG